MLEQMCGRIDVGGHVKVTGQLERVDGRSLTYDAFVDHFMALNRSIVLIGLTTTPPPGDPARTGRSRAPTIIAAQTLGSSPTTSPPHLSRVKNLLQQFSYPIPSFTPYIKLSLHPLNRGDRSPLPYSNYQARQLFFPFRSLTLARDPHQLAFPPERHRPSPAGAPPPTFPRPLDGCAPSSLTQIDPAAHGFGAGEPDRHGFA
ncbi:hypothetical protein EJB05_15879, partial [Eragrostis curvula]